MTNRTYPQGVPCWVDTEQGQCAMICSRGLFLDSLAASTVLDGRMLLVAV